jgi:hypothetical protein
MGDRRDNLRCPLTSPQILALLGGTFRRISQVELSGLLLSALRTGKRLRQTAAGVLHNWRRIPDRTKEALTIPVIDRKTILHHAAKAFI